MKVWRIVNPMHLESAFSGIGAELNGGRFNSKGRKAVYTSGAISLAMLELLVQANKRQRLAGYLCISATFDDAKLETLDVAHLPEDWDARPYTRVSQGVGDAWLHEKRSLVLRVPSVVVPQEYNFIINPLHPDFGDLELGEPFEAPFDRRLIDLLE